MAWLGSTLGDGLTSLKGQITKITKDVIVMADDPLGSTSYEGRINELEELLKAKETEIKKLQYANEVLKSHKNFEWSDDQFQDVCTLETKVSELKSENKRLEKLLEDYDADYQKELENILKDRDNWKKAAENNRWQSSTGEEAGEIIRQLTVKNNVLLEEGKKKDRELEYYKSEVSRLKGTVLKPKADNKFNTSNGDGAIKQELENVNLMAADSKNSEEEIRNLKVLVEEKEIKFAECIEEIKRIHGENQMLDSDNSSLMTEKAEMEVLVQNLRATVNDLEINLSKERESVGELDLQHADFVKMLKDIQLEKETNEHNLTSKIQNIQSEHESVIMKLKEVEASNIDEHRQYTIIIDGLKTEKTNLTERCEELLEEINILSSNQQSLRDKIDELTNSQKSSNVTNASHQNPINMGNKLVDEVNMTAMDTGYADEVQNHFYRQIEENVLQNENTSLKETVKSLSTLNDELKQRISDNERAMQDLTTKNEELKSAMSELEASSASKVEIDRLTEEFQSFQGHIGALRSSLEEKDNQLKEFSEGTGKLASENYELAKKLKLLKDKDETVERLASQLADCQEQVKRLETELEKKENLLTTLSEEKNEFLEMAGLINTLREQHNIETKRFTDEIKQLQMTLSAQTSENEKQINSLSQHVEKLREENGKLVEELQEIRTHFEGKIPVACEWMTTLEQEALQLANFVGVAVTRPINMTACMQEVSAKISQLLEERIPAGNISLGLEIRKLKSLINRIRRELMLSVAERGQLEAYADPELVDEQGETLLTQSQTDDVKRLKQDIAQMTEILGMIDRGLNSILKDKSKLEKELSVLHSMSSKTEKELSSVVRDRDLWKEQKKQLLEDLEIKEVDVKTLQEAIAKEKCNTRELKTSLNAALQEKSNLDTQLKLKEKLLKENAVHQDRLLELEDSLPKQSKQIEALTLGYKNKDQSDSGKDLLASSIIPEDATIDVERDWKTIAAEMAQNCEALEAKCKELEEIRAQNLSTQEKNDLEDMIKRLQNENADLKSLVQQLRENIIAMGSKASNEVSHDDHSRHRRSLSQVVFDNNGGGVEALRAELDQEHCRYQTLTHQNQALTEKEASLRKELERLRKHLVEVEEHYTSEAIQAEQTLNECRSKLGTAEDQLRNSSTVYKSANVRSTQHLEALQNQIRLMSVQRDDLQAKLSTAEDQMQKQSASLASLQMVLEQFQLDKERELHAAATKNEYQLQLAGRRSAELEAEINSLKEQLTDAKNGLKAALRLGEQLDRKSQQISALEDELKKNREELIEANKKIATANETTAAKIDKFLVKNLFLGYLSAGQGNTKAQALKILVSVLGLTEEEKAKFGVDSQSGWFSSLLHPSPGGSVATEPLSQAFIRFLESESRPQPQLKLLPENSANISSNTPKRPPLVLSELVLPNFNPSQPSEGATSALNDVLKDS